MHQDEDPAAKRRRQATEARERKARWLEKQSQESLLWIWEADAESHRRHIDER